jgi:hypothetical protein
MLARLWRLACVVALGVGLLVGARALGAALPAGDQLAYSYSNVGRDTFTTMLFDTTHQLGQRLRPLAHAMQLRGWIDPQTFLVAIPRVTTEFALVTLDGAAQPLYLPPTCQSSLIAGRGDWIVCFDRANSTLALYTLECALRDCGSPAHTLATNGVPVQLAFTQDAAHLAVLFQRIDSRQIAVYDTSSGERVWHTPAEQARVSVPTWSPDSTQLAYYHEIGSALWLNTLDLHEYAEATIPLLTDETVIPYQISWSPDSAYILIHHTGERNDTAPPSWSVIDLHKGTRSYLAGSTAFDIDPLWSPTGNYVALTRRYGTRFGARLYLLDKQGSANLLTPHQLLDLDVYWRPP